jgi:hypothetical protein
LKLRIVPVSLPLGCAPQARHRALAVPAVHDRVPAERERPAEERDPGELALGHEAPGDRQRQHQRADVRHALVVAHEHARPPGIDVLEPLDLDPHAAAREDPAHPLAADPDHALAAPVDEGDETRRDAPRDRVEHDQQVARDVDHAERI